MTKWGLLIAGSLLSLAASPAANAQSRTQFLEVSEEQRALDDGLYSGQSLERYLTHTQNQLRMFDRDRDGLDADDVLRMQRIAEASRRSQSVSRILTFDLNGDLQVTADEIDRFYRGTADANQQYSKTTMAEFDKDNDGIITLHEAAALTNYVPGDELVQVRALLLLDLDRNGKVSLEEMQAAASRHFASVDADRDGRISEQEAVPVQDRKSIFRNLARVPNCTFKRPGPDAQIVLVKSSGPRTMSPVALGNPDQVVTVSNLAIEPKGKPLYLVLYSGEPVIWRLTGATERVETVVLATDEWTRGRQTGAERLPGTGIVGVDQDKVTFADQGCLAGWSSDPVSVASVRYRIKKYAGRLPEAVLSDYEHNNLLLPSGTGAPLIKSDRAMPAGFSSADWPKAIMYYKGGLARFSAAQVVAKATPIPYQVLPNQFGIAQIIGNGAAQRIDERTLRLVRPIPNLPAGLAGAHTENFLLADDVPLPPGDPIHSCVKPESPRNPAKPTRSCSPPPPPETVRTRQN